MAGSFKERENAERQVQKLKSAGFDATIIARVPGTLLIEDYKITTKKEKEINP